MTNSNQGPLAPVNFSEVTLNGRTFRYLAEFPLKKIAEVVEKINFTEDGCWVWTGASGPGGYGNGHLNGGMMPAHRLVYRLMVGELDKGKHVHHVCKNRMCVNPGHLQSVTPEQHYKIEATLRHKDFCVNGHEMTAENTYTVSTSDRRRCKLCKNKWAREQYEKKRVAKGERTHCHRGHEYTEENVQMYQGRRYCKACHAENTLRYYHEKKNSLKAMEAGQDNSSQPIEKENEQNGSHT